MNPVEKSKAILAVDNDLETIRIWRGVKSSVPGGPITSDVMKCLISPGMGSSTIPARSLFLNPEDTKAVLEFLADRFTRRMEDLTSAHAL